MTARRYNPQGYAEIERHKLSESVRQFLNREISDDVFRACLHARGFRGVRLDEEFRYQDSLRITASYSQ